MDTITTSKSASIHFLDTDGKEFSVTISNPKESVSDITSGLQNLLEKAKVTVTGGGTLVQNGSLGTGEGQYYDVAGYAEVPYEIITTKKTIVDVSGESDTTISKVITQKTVEIPRVAL